jgi:hypothetical protein
MSSTVQASISHHPNRVLSLVSGWGVWRNNAVPYPPPGYRSVGVTCGWVRGSVSLTLPILVGCMVFSNSSKKPYTPLQNFGTRQRAFVPLHTRCVQQVTPIEHAPLLGRGCFFSASPKKYTPRQNGLARTCVHVLPVCTRSLQDGDPIEPGYRYDSSSPMGKNGCPNPCILPPSG